METEYQTSLGEGFEAQPHIGELLKQARLKRGLELAEIAALTRVPVRHLTAIEADMHDSLPALPYTIGFVKAFARAVDYDAEAAAAQFRAETTKMSHVPQTLPLEPLDEARVPSRGLVLGSLLAVLLLIVGALVYGSGAFDRAASPDIVTAEPSAGTEAVQSDTTENGFDVPPGSAVETAAPAAAPAAAMPAATAMPAVAADAPVVITATEDAWLKIYDQATRQSVKMGILKAGERYEVPAGRTDLLLWTGRAGALRISVGGQTLPPLGALTDTVRDVSLAPIDLAARGAGGVQAN